MLLTRHPLPTDWVLRSAVPAAPPGLPEAIAGTVPGCVHTDLMLAGLLPDPFLDTNEIAQDWVGRQDWTYQTDFEWAGDGEAQQAARVDLVFEGLDTFATIMLNGHRLGATRNMHRTFRFDATPHLRRGANRIEVAFRSAWAVGAELAAEVAPRPSNYPGPANLMRKMACNFGWDWGPTVVTCGIWKPVRLESWSVARLAEVRPQVGLAGGRGQVGVDVVVDRLGIEGPLRVEAEGELDRWTRAVGFRSVRLDTTPDDQGSAFALVVNEVPVWVCGANWIPDDAFLHRVTPRRTRERVAQAKAAHVNLLRVWGGGIHETDAFYEACDEAGVLVWQDFLFACAAYPEEAELPAEIEAEARDNIVRLMPPPRLFCGTATTRTSGAGSTGAGRNPWAI